MRIAVPQGAKLYPVDRNPTNVVGWYSFTHPGPLPPTAVWAYMVPWERILLLQLSVVYVRVTAADTLAGRTYAQIRVEDMPFFIAESPTDVAGNISILQQPVNVLFVPGIDIISVVEIVGTGNVQFGSGIIGVEFDR